MYAHPPIPQQLGSVTFNAADVATAASAVVDEMSESEWRKGGCREERMSGCMLYQCMATYPHFLPF